MTTESTNEPKNPGLGRQIEDLVAAPELLRSVAGDEFKMFLDRVPIGIAISRQHDERQRIVYANVALAAMLGQRSDAIEGKTWEVFTPLLHEDDSSLSLAQSIGAGDDFLGTFRLDRDRAEPLIVEAYASQIAHDDGSETYRIAALVDVSRRERAQREALEHTIREKDLLLKELQHRVKNNLQLITAMIRLQSRGAERGETIDLDKLAARVEALALLYQAISAADGADDVDLGHYLGQIAAAAMRVHAHEGIGLNLTTSYSPVSVNVAMPIGLLVNEVFTNAFKYAFSGRERGELTLTCERSGSDRYTVTFSDNGVGLPTGVQWPGRGKLAGLIVQTLRENTGDTDFQVTSKPGEGTSITINFAHTPLSAVKN